MSYVGIIIAAAVGSWVGASVMYWAARLAGRPLIFRFFGLDSPTSTSLWRTLSQTCGPKRKLLLLFSCLRKSATIVTLRWLKDRRSVVLLTGFGRKSSELSHAPARNLVRSPD